jgi:hypothetical protein
MGSWISNIMSNVSETANKAVTTAGTAIAATSTLGSNNEAKEEPAPADETAAGTGGGRRKSKKNKKNKKIRSSKSRKEKKC